MSSHALSWSLLQSPSTSSAKFVLVVMSNYAGSNGECFTSIAKIAHETGLDDRTVRKNLRLLVAENFIVDTGRKIGRTKQIPVFVLSSYAAWLNPPKNGSLPDSNPPKNVGKDSQKCISNPPKNGRETLKAFTQEHDLEASRKSVRQSEEQRSKNAVHIADLLNDLGVRNV